MVAVTQTAGNSAARPRLLFLCQTLPYPPDGGVNIRTYNVLRLLSRVFDITALYFYRAKDRVSRDAVEGGLRELRKLGEAEAFEIPQEHSRARFIRDHLGSVLQRRSYTIPAYESRPFRERLQSLLRNRSFDLVHMDSLDLVGYLPLLRDFPVVCVHHNVESDLLRRRAASEQSRLIRWYLNLQANWVEKEEKQWCGRLALNVAVSEADRAALEARLPAGTGRFVVVPNGVDTNLFTPRPGAGAGVVFVGGLNWFPNHDALSFFSKDILPILRRRVDAPVRWVGRASDEQKRTYAANGIELTGYVDDVRPYLADAACFVVPIRAGGGTRLKILDAWASGKAVVSTSVGCEGLETRDGENILIRDTPDEFARAVELVLQNDVLRRRLEEGARQTAVARYDWEVIGRSMIRQYEMLLPARTRVRAAESLAV